MKAISALWDATVRFISSSVSRGHPKTGIKRSLIVLIIVASILPVVLSIGNIAFNILYLSNPESVSYSNRAENRYGIGRRKNTVYGMYEPGVYKNCDMTVTNVERSQGVSYDHPSAGMEYVIVTIRIRNISTTAPKIFR